MKFGEWYASTPRGYNPTLTEAFKAGAASRDAEVAELRDMISEIQAARRMRKEHDDLLAKNHRLREQVTLLRDALLDCDASFDQGRGKPASLDEALAATEPTAGASS